MKNVKIHGVIKNLHQLTVDRNTVRKNVQRLYMNDRNMERFQMLSFMLNVNNVEKTIMVFMALEDFVQHNVQKNSLHRRTKAQKIQK